MSQKGSGADGRGLLWLAAALGLLGIAIRVNNAFRYPPRWGFDALFNERYVERLLHSWVLPAPDTDWATAHPPLFYYLSAGIGRALDTTDPLDVIVPARLVSTTLGLGMVWAAWALVRRADPGRPRRALLAAGLLLFLPVHIYMSAMLNEEIVAASFGSLAILLASVELSRTRSEPGRRRLRNDAAVGLAAGLALLTKLSGVLSLAAAGGAYLWLGLREHRLGPAISRAAVVAGVALAVGGWFYARNLALYGYLYPQDLSTHTLMFSMPPGERHVLDYLRVPLATWTDPQALSPDLLHSVWGSTYVSLWYEGHGHFLPAHEPAVKRMGTVVLALALLPTAAFGVGILRGVRRALREASGTDTLLVLLSALTLVGYVGFTWGNPWFATVKASYLLGMSLPFAYYASEVLADWTERSSDVGVAIWVVLGTLLLCVALAFTQDIGLWNLTPDGALPGLEWDQRGRWG